MPNPAPPQGTSPLPKRPIGASAVGKLVVSCVFGGLLLYALERAGVPLLPPPSAFAQVKWWTVPPYLALVLASAYFRGVRWRLLLRPVANVSRGQALSAVLIGSAAVLLMPLRLGEMARPVLIARTQRVSAMAALGTVVAERIIDGLVLSLILAGCLLVVPISVPSSTLVVGLSVPISAVRGYAWTFLFTFAAAFGAIVVFFAARSVGQRLVHLTVGRFSTRLAAIIAGRLASFADGLAFLRDRRLAFEFLLETCVYWLIAALCYWFLGWGAGVVHADQTGMTFGEACAIMGVLGIATVLPGPPGLLGLFQAGLYAGMTMYYPKPVITGPGAAYVFLVYVLQLAFTVVAAVVCLAISAARKSGAS